MNTCPSCGTGMKALFTGLFCPNDCDKPKAAKPAPTGLKYYTRFDGARCVVVSRVDDIPLDAKEGLWIDAGRVDSVGLRSPKTVEEAMQWTHKTVGLWRFTVGIRTWQECGPNWAKEISDAPIRVGYMNFFNRGFLAAYVIPGN